MENAENIQKIQLQRLFNVLSKSDLEFVRFLDENICRFMLLDVLHPEGPRCPECQAKVRNSQESHFWHGHLLRCRHCGKSFTGRTGTLLANKSLQSREIVLMLWLMNRGESDMQIAGEIGCNRETVRLWRRELGIE